jgi:hypothetical protein
MTSLKILAGVVCLSMCAFADDNGKGNGNGDSKPGDTDGGKVIHEINGHGNGNAGVRQARTNPILYHGGPIMTGTTNVYYIWYGSWTPGDQMILTQLASNIGGSPWFNINTTYYNSTSTFVTNSVHYAGSTTDNYSQGKNLSDAAVQAIVSTAINSPNGLPKDTNGVYFVLTSADVNETSGFCTQYCGWHTRGTIAGSDIKYAFIGNAARCPSACAAQTTSPNGSLGPDAMASIIGHELSESVTDPDLNAWFDRSGQENADKCAWTFGTVQRASNGSFYNVTLGVGLQYLIQQNWVQVTNGGFCAMSH